MPLYILQQLCDMLQMASKDAAQLWGTVYGHATSKDKVAIMRLLKVQAAMRAELQGFLKCRDSTVSPDLHWAAGLKDDKQPISAAQSACEMK